MQAAACKPSSSSRSQKDLRDIWLVIREGSLSEVESSLASLKKSGGDINQRNVFGSTLLHIATWRNHIPIVKRLLAAGADPDTRDGESGWSSLHRAMHFGHLAVASVLLQAGASIALEDSKSRTPIDLISGPVLQCRENQKDSVIKELFSWGSGVNYQLGTGNTHMQKSPCKIDSLSGFAIKLVSASKFHSVAIGNQGELYTWGFGRGGRLGHSDFDIHSGQAAVITPRRVTAGLGSRRVRAVAAAKHHTVIATEGGDVFTWGSNREGQLGYTSVDTQATPRRVSSLRSKIVDVAAGNKHTAGVSESGEVFTWGCNREGQLGYGTSNSASNYAPRIVEYLKGKTLVGVSAAKHHTIVLAADGEVLTWGHRLVTPKRVVIARNINKCGNIPLKFHRTERLHVNSIAAGMMHSLALTDDGAMFCWNSSDPDLKCFQVSTVCGRHMVSISAGKYWMSAVSNTGDVYLWDGKREKEKLVVNRLFGIKKATSVSVGETHMLIISSLYVPAQDADTRDTPERLLLETRNEPEEFDDDVMFNNLEINDDPIVDRNRECDHRLVPNLKSLCERVVIVCLLEPRSALQLLEIADSLGADDLRKQCEEIVMWNLDYIFSVSTHVITGFPLEILCSLEKLLYSRPSDRWCNRYFPTPTASLPAVINVEEVADDSDLHLHGCVEISSKKERTASCFDQPKNLGSDDLCKQVRALRKKLQQIEVLEEKQSRGHILDGQQTTKLRKKHDLVASLSVLGFPVDTTIESSSVPSYSGGKPSKKKYSRKMRKQKSSQAGDTVETLKTEIPCDHSDKDDFVRVQHSGCAMFEGIKMGKLLPEHLFQASNKDLNATATSQGWKEGSNKKKNRMGGLSTFLSGGLDDAPKVDPVPSPASLAEGPVWGGAKMSKCAASLRDIQNEQKTSLNQSPQKVKNQIGNATITIPLINTDGSMMTRGQLHDNDGNTPPWASSGTPPIQSRPSFRDIQMQQKGKQHQDLSSIPKTRTVEFSVGTGQGSPDSPALNRWFKPEAESTSSIRSIQIEEMAMKDLRRYYNSVRLMKN